MMGMASWATKMAVVTLKNSYDRSTGIAGELLQAVPVFTAAMAYKISENPVFRDCVQLCGINNAYHGVVRYIGGDNPYQGTTNATSTVAYATAGEQYVILYV